MGRRNQQRKQGTTARGRQRINTERVLAAVAVNLKSLTEQVQKLDQDILSLRLEVKGVWKIKLYLLWRKFTDFWRRKRGATEDIRESSSVDFSTDGKQDGSANKESIAG